MTRKRARGLFITGTDTDVGKTYVATRIARQLGERGHKVGAYKPASSGCRRDGERLIADDAEELLRAIGGQLTAEEICPQRFAAPLAPHLAAAAEGRFLDKPLLRSGLQPCAAGCEVVIVEGAGGLLSPLGDELVADLAGDFRYPLVVVARNSLGAINQVLQTLLAAENYRNGLSVAAVVLSATRLDAGDLSRASNAAELRGRCNVPIVELAHGAAQFEPSIDWLALAGG